MPQSNEARLSAGARFWRLLRPDRREIRNIYVYAIFNGLITLSLPLGIQAIVNLIQGGQVSTSWIVLVALVVAGVALGGVLQIYQLRIVENLQQKIFARAAFEFAYRIPRIQFRVLLQQYAPELMNRFFDIVTLQKGLSKILIDFSAALLQIGFGLLLLSVYHPLFILFSTMMALYVFLVFRLTVQRGLKTSLDESSHKYRLTHWLEELARTAATFRRSRQEDLSLDRTNAHTEQYLISREAHFNVLRRQYMFMVLFKVLVVAGLLAIGGILVMEQLMNIGQFVAAEIIILMIISSVEKLLYSIETIYDVLTGLQKIAQVTDLPLEKSASGSNRNALPLSEQGGGMRIELCGVDFTYPSALRPTIHGQSLKIEAGQRVLIAGSNGAGKSTLIHLIGGLFEPDDGQMLYDGIPRGSISMVELRRHVGDCLSEQQLFEGTLWDNISLGEPGLSVERALDVLESVGLNNFIRQQPQGLETRVLPQGINLPRSVRQLLLIVRSVVRQPRLLLLEDALEHLDIASRKRVIDYLIREDHPWTLVAVSSDAYLAARVDRILIMREGRLVADGNFDTIQTQFPQQFIHHA